jgi:hypothetical protein
MIQQVNEKIKLRVKLVGARSLRTRNALAQPNLMRAVSGPNPSMTFSNSRGFLITIPASRRGFEAIWRIGASEAVMARGYSSPFGGSNARDFGASSPQPRTRTVAFPRRNQAPRASPESGPRETAPAMPPNPPKAASFHAKFPNEKRIVL